MTAPRIAHYTRVGLAIALALGIGVLAGCGGGNSASNTTAPKPTAKKPAIDSSTAKGSATIAVSRLATVAPDAKVLLGQIVAPIPATSTPMWDFLIGSQKQAMVYSVLVNNGVAQYQLYAKIKLSAAEWAKIPPVSDWKIDSGPAKEKALAVYPQGKLAKWTAQFLTYRPLNAPKTASKPMTWVFTFDPASQGKAATNTVNVDMITGAAALAK